ncbi:MAG: hypothetical protein RBR59_05825 [Sulfurimonadaceae bacterium]|jgi:hypothetical protein|nr:hypothetical protein [Sulfurimonadaceae bacterium]
MNQEINNQKLSKQEEIALLLQDAETECKHLRDKTECVFDLCDYIYTTQEAISELGLDDELIHQLVEDYVEQVLKTKQLFSYYITELDNARENHKPLDFIPLRELAHKNLGVARNLRIKDGQSILEKMMHEENIDCLRYYLKALEVCAIKLKPEVAYNTIKLIKIKSTIF